MFTESENKLIADFKFKNFKEAFSFMTEVAMHAEQMNHHPNWSNIWNTVQINLSTHDAGNVVTEKDHELAKRIVEVYHKYKTQS